MSRASGTTDPAELPQKEQCSISGCLTRDDELWVVERRERRAHVQIALEIVLQKVLLVGLRVAQKHILLDK